MNVGSKISFSIYGNIGGKTNFKGTVLAQYAGAVVPPTAGAMANHANIYPVLPQAIKDTIQDDYTSYTYIDISVEGKSYVIGTPWINEGTLTSVVERTAVVTIPGFTDQDTTKLRHLLKSRNYNVTDIDVS